MDELKNKVAVVTGASRGIGEAAARAFAACGTFVALAARSVDDIERIAAEIRDSGGQAIAVRTDIAQYHDVARLIDTARSEFGGLDILVNNAGIIDPIARIADSDPDLWSHVADVNYKGVYYGLRAALPHMAAQGSGVVVNISSGAASSALEGWSHYCSTKAAVLMLTRCADKEYADKGVRTVGLSPGTVATDMQVQIKASGINPVSQLDSSAHISPEWVAKAILYLSTSEASDLSGIDFSLKTEEGRRRIGLAP